MDTKYSSRFFTSDPQLLTVEGLQQHPFDSVLADIRHPRLFRYWYSARAVIGARQLCQRGEMAQAGSPVGIASAGWFTVYGRAPVSITAPVSSWPNERS